MQEIYSKTSKKYGESLASGRTDIIKIMAEERLQIFYKRMYLCVYISVYRARNSIIIFKFMNNYE